MSEERSGEIILYTGVDGHAKVEVVYEGDTFWLTQKQIADLFNVDRTVVTKHLGNIFDEQGLDRGSVCAEFAHTAVTARPIRFSITPTMAITAWVRGLKRQQNR
ncbi:MAG: hypothetical protein ACR2HJ_04900 [Fimbriimonadales bacterium]